MDVVIGGRQTGKTSWMIDLFLDTPDSIILTIDAAERDRIRDLVGNQYQAPERMRDIVTVTAYRARGYDSLRPVYIDNVDLVLQSFLNVHPDVVTATGTHATTLYAPKEEQ